MIVMFFVNSVVNILCGVLTGMQILSLPVDLIGALATCVQYGQYIMGRPLSCGACVCHVLDRVKGYGGITYIYLETSSINLIVGMSRRT